jgi:hypothetical protein
MNHNPPPPPQDDSVPSKRLKTDKDDDSSCRETEKETDGGADATNHKNASSIPGPGAATNNNNNNSNTQPVTASVGAARGRPPKEPKKLCSSCFTAQGSASFHINHWNVECDRFRICLKCLHFSASKQLRYKGRVLQVCGNCSKAVSNQGGYPFPTGKGSGWKGKSNIHKDDKVVWCVDCWKLPRTCTMCLATKEFDGFDPKQWAKPFSPYVRWNKRICHECLDQPRECCKCKSLTSKDQCSAYFWGDDPTLSLKCNKCEEEDRAEMNALTLPEG